MMVNYLMSLEAELGLWEATYGEQPYPTPEFDGCMLLLNETEAELRSYKGK